ncbi:MAG: DinB family protein [Sciscionella sp.]
MTPAANRPHTPKQADERQTLAGFLDHYRATLAIKCEGLTAAQLAQRSAPPSGLSLLGLVRHVGEVERGLFRGFACEQVKSSYCTESHPDGDFDDATGTDECVSEAFGYWNGEIEHARKIVAGASSLDQTLYRQRTDSTVSLRWILVHMIEEYARHSGAPPADEGVAGGGGHADLLRERIDGVTGD